MYEQDRHCLNHRPEGSNTLWPMVQTLSEPSAIRGVIPEVLIIVEVNIFEIDASITQQYIQGVKLWKVIL